jgi:hypothetical protein
MKPMTKAQSAALARHAAGMSTWDVRPATTFNLVKRGYLALVPMPKNPALMTPVITQAGRDAAFAALAAN